MLSRPTMLDALTLGFDDFHHEGIDLFTFV